MLLWGLLLILIELNIISTVYWATPDLRERTPHQSTVSISFKYHHLLPRWPYSSHNNYDLKYTISRWKTPEGQRHFIVSSLSSFCPWTLPTLAQTQQSFMEYNKVQLQLTCHLFFFQRSVLWRIAVRSVHSETTTKAKRQATDFSFWDHKGRVVSPLIMHTTSAEAASQSSSARQRQLWECCLVLQRLTSAGPNNFRLLIWCLHQTLAMEDGGPLDSFGFNL